MFVAFYGRSSNNINLVYVPMDFASLTTIFAVATTICAFLCYVYDKYVCAIDEYKVIMTTKNVININ